MNMMRINTAHSTSSRLSGRSTRRVAPVPPARYAPQGEGTGHAAEQIKAGIRKAEDSTEEAKSKTMTTRERMSTDPAGTTADVGHAIVDGALELGGAILAGAGALGHGALNGAAETVHSAEDAAIAAKRAVEDRQRAQARKDTSKD